MNTERINRTLARPWFPHLILAIAVFGVWGQTIRFGFVWDDQWFVSNLQSIRSLHNFWGIFYRLDAQSSLPDGFLLFRPIRTAHYALLYFLGGQAAPQPWIYHLANVIWHAGVAAMLFAVLCRVLPRMPGTLTRQESRAWSFLIALAFAVHPVVSEVVCWVKSLDDILAAFFTLAALRELLPVAEEATVHDQGAPQNFWRSSAFGRAVFFFAVAIYSKESAVPFAIVPLLIFHRIYRLPWKECWARTSPFVVLVAIYVVHRHLVIGRTSQTSPLSGSYAQTLVDMIPISLKYFRLLWGIPPFYIDYSFLEGGNHLTSLPVLGGLALLTALVVAAVLAGCTQRGKLLAAGLAWTGLFLLPVSNLVPTMQYMAERFLYLPLIGWLAAVGAIALLAPGRKAVVAAAGVLICFWGVTAWNRSWIWQDELTLFVRSSQEGPITSRIQNNAVSAILHLPHVQQFFSTNSPAQGSGESDRTSTETLAKVLNTLELARNLFPDDPNVLSCYGQCLARGGEPGKALPSLEKAAQLKPENLEFLLNLARAGMDADQLPVAEAALDKATHLAPTNITVLKLRISSLCLKQDFTAAQPLLLHLNEIEPGEDNFRWLTNVEARIQQSRPR